MELEPDEVYKDIERAVDKGYLDTCYNQFYLKCLCMQAKQMEFLTDELVQMNKHLEQIAAEAGGLSVVMADKD